MQLTTVLVLLASIYCASADIECWKGNDKDVKLVPCDTIKDTCATTTYEMGTVTRGCASHQECKGWQDTAIEKKHPYTVDCCNTGGCNKVVKDANYGEGSDSNYEGGASNYGGDGGASNYGGGGGDSGDSNYGGAGGGSNYGGAGGDGGGSNYGGSAGTY